MFDSIPLLFFYIYIGFLSVDIVAKQLYREPDIYFSIPNEQTTGNGGKKEKKTKYSEMT